MKDRLGREDVLDLGSTDSVRESSESSVGRRVRITADDRRTGKSETLLGADNLATGRVRSDLRLRRMTGTHVNDTLTLVGHSEKVDAELLDVFLEGNDLETRIGSAKTK